MEKNSFSFPLFLREKGEKMVEKTAIMRELMLFLECIEAIIRKLITELHEQAIVKIVIMTIELRIKTLVLKLKNGSSITIAQVK